MNRARILTGATAAAAAAVTLTACGTTSSSSSSPDTSPTPTTSSSRSPHTGNTSPRNDHITEAVYLHILRDQHIKGTDDTLTEIGHKLCTLMDQPGEDATTVGVTLLTDPDWPWDASTTGTVMGAASAAWCPHHRDDFNNNRKPA